MPDAKQRLALIISAKNQADAELRRLNKAITSAASTTELFTKAATAGAGAIIAVEAAAVAMGKSWMDAGVKVAEFSSALGVSTEEASALMEIAEDLNIPIGSLEMGFKKMAKEGIEPSIAGLVEVRSRLGEAKTSADRLALAQKLLGRSGADLLPMFDQLTDEQLVNYVTGMKDAQVWTEEATQRAIELRDTMKDTADNYEAAKLTLGYYLVVLTDAKDRLERLNNVLDGSISYWDALNGRIGPIEVVTKNLEQDIRGIAGGLEDVAGIEAEPTIELTLTVNGQQVSIERFLMLTSRGQNRRFVAEATGSVIPSSVPYKPPTRKSGDQEGWASGGFMSGSGSYLVGEHGAERFTPGASGNLAPANDPLVQEIRRMVRTLPVILRDAVQKA